MLEVFFYAAMSWASVTLFLLVYAPVRMEWENVQELFMKLWPAHLLFFVVFVTGIFGFQLW